MPRSRNTRSSSPLKSLKTTTGQSEYDRIFQNVQEMFSDAVDADVIYFVLSECHWKSEEAIDKLLMIVEQSEASPIKTKSKLQEIAEGVLGPLRHDECQEQGHTHPAFGQNPRVSTQGTSAGVRTTGHPVSSKETSNEDLQTGFKSSPSPSPLNFQARGGAVSPNAEKSMHSVSSDPVLAWDFPPLQKELSDMENAASKTLQEKAGNESWRAIRAPKSLRTSSNSPHRNLGRDSELINSGFDNQDVFSEDQNTTKGKGDKPVRPRLEINRNFPVRLLSKSPEEMHEKITFPQTIQHSLSESVLSTKNKNVNVAQPESFELDETVIKCISEINNDLLDETEKKVEKGLFGRSRSSSIRSQASENESGGTGASTPDPTHVRTSTPSNHPMTLPVIGLSVEAPEFVPRPKKTKTEEIAQTSSDIAIVTSSTRSSPLSAAPLKVDTKPIPIPVSSPHQGVSPAIRIGSPRIAVVSPGCAISPPANLPITSSAHFTGSPMFITPKWQPVFPGMYPSQQPPPPLQPQLLAQQLPQQLPQQYPQGYRFPSPGAQFPAYSGVVYPVGARPVFRVAGMPPRLPQVPMPQSVQMVTEVNNNIVAMATGQPIMATRESIHPGVHPVNLETMKTQKWDKPSWIDVCKETVRSLMKAGKKTMVIVRGLPGSGKSTLARAIQFDGVVLSTDDYFTKGDIYEYDADRLTEAHQWNRERAKEAIKLGTSPIIIDNTNTQKWEFKTYISMLEAEQARLSLTWLFTSEYRSSRDVAHDMREYFQALNNNYHVEIMEPDTPWKWKPKELAKHTIHGVPEDQIQRMLCRYEKNLSVAVVSNKANKPLLNGSADMQTQNSNTSKENSLSPAVERKPLKSARNEAARRSRSRGKSNKVRDSKASRNVQKQSNGSMVGFSDISEQQDLHVTKDSKAWERQTLSPSLVQSSEIANTSFTEDWTADDWPELKNDSQDDFIIYEKNEADIDLDTRINSDSVVTPNSGRSSVASLQGEVNFIPHHANILSTTSSKTASPIIEFDIVEAYNPSDKHDKNFMNPSKETSEFYTDKINLKDIERELSTEVLGFVNEIMEEHSSLNFSELSQEDKVKLVEELKAFLQFYPVEDEEQRRKAETLISIKINQSEIKSENTFETTLGENIHAEPYKIQENTELGMVDEQVVNGYVEDIAEANGHTTESDVNCVSLQDIDAERTSDGSVDLDSSLNKEVANIFNGSHLRKLQNISDVKENMRQETIETVSESTNLMELENLDNFNHCAENNEIKSLESSNNSATCVTRDSNFPVQEVCLGGVKPQELFNLQEIIPIHVSPKEKTSPREKTSIYEIDSAIIRAETSDFGETDSLFENDSAIIAVSGTDAMDRDSLLETDSAIIAASTDIKDTNNLSMFETDSAIIAASKDLLDTEVIVEDSDVMKRLKATVEELKYWGHIETEESESVEKVVTEWDGFEQSANDEWQNIANAGPVRAKPQRKRKLKSESNNDEENVLKQLEVKEVVSKDTEYIEILDTCNLSQNEIDVDAAGRQEKENKLTAYDYTETPQSLNTVNIIDMENKLDSDNPSYVQSCFNNNSEMFNQMFLDSEEAGNYFYGSNEDVLNSATSDTSQNEIPAGLPDSEHDVDEALLGAEIDLQKESDLDNSIFISDDEENLNNSHVSKSESDAWKTASSDDNIFVSDDDMAFLTANLEVDGLQTVTIQEETIPVENSETCMKDNEDLVRLTESNEQQEIIDLNSQSAESGQHVSSENSFLYETASSIGNENESVISEESGNLAGDNLIENTQESLAETDIIPLHTSSEISIIESASAGSTLHKNNSEHSVSSQEGNKEYLKQNPVSLRKQKQSKRRLAAKLSQPFFDVSDTEKFASNDWNTFSSAFERTETYKPKVDKTMEETDFISEGTLTESGDFRLLNIFCQGESVEYVPEYKFIKTRSRSIDMSEEELARYNSNLEKPVSSEVRKVDKSSYTDDLKTDMDIENIQFLKTCFPNISEDELDCVLMNCANNVEWTLNLLLDWKYHLDYTDEEKEHFAKEISKCKRCPSPEVLDLSNEVVVEGNPETLLDLCFKKIDKENIAAREDLEKQLIQTGKERLDRIEDDNITKIRLRRSTSLSESSFDRSSVSASQSFIRMRRSVSDPHQNIDSVFLNTSTKFDKSGLSVQGTVISPIKKIINETSELEKSLNKEAFNDNEKSVKTEEILTKRDAASVPGLERDSMNKTAICDEPDQQNVSDLRTAGSSYLSDSATEEKEVDQQQESDISASEGGQSLSSPRPAEQNRSLSSVTEPDRSLTSPGPVVVTLALDKSVISRLELLFGPVGDNSITDHGDLEVPVNLETARLLHQCVRTSLQDDRFLKYKQMKADEELARKLQAEQDHNDSQVLQSPSKRLSGSRRGQPVSLAQLSEQRLVPPPSPLKREPVKPLAEIMEEEMSKQKTREELQRYLESEGGTAAIATRMKRKKLYESFPTIDTTLLDQIFEANCYNLSETIESIQTSVSYQPVQTVMTREMEEEYYRKLTETVKRQSAMDMLDTFDSFPEDYPYDDFIAAQFEDYRGEATLHHKLRLQCFQKAADAHRKGLKQVASFYSQEGHLHTQKLKEANMRAAENILEDRHKDLETKMTLDLHGLLVDEAVAALDRILPEKEKERYKSHLTIVTGVGRHSHRGIPKLRPAVLAYLQKHQYSFTELHPGAFRVTLKNR